MRQIFLFAFVIFLSESCNIGASGIWKNGHIDKEKKIQLDALNDKLFKTINDNNVAGLKAMMSDEAIQTGGDLNNFMTQVSTTLKADNYKVLDEYYVQSSTIGINNTIPGVINNNSYTINHIVSNKEMFVSLLLPNGHGNDALILAIYGNYGSEWKLNILKIGQYSLFQKNATDYYRLAKEYNDKKYWVDAYINISVAEKLSRPANDIFIFQTDKEINTLNDSIKSELNANFPLPLTLDKINGKPKIIGIYPEMGDESVCPMVQYLTTIKLKDTALLKEENMNMRKEVKTLFNGIAKNKKYIFFRAFNEIPNGQKLVEHYGFIDELAK